MVIEGLKKYQGRNPHGYFADLTPSQRRAAYQLARQALCSLGAQSPAVGGSPF
jgi:hypothetical protein